MLIVDWYTALTQVNDKEWLLKWLLQTAGIKKPPEGGSVKIQ